MSKQEYHEKGTYEANDIFTGVSGVSGNIATSGKWRFEKLSDRRFHLWGEPVVTNPPVDAKPWDADFEIIDDNHIKNIQKGYIIVRLAK